MNRIALTFIALLASACATEADMTVDVEQDDVRAALEDGDFSTDRSSSRAARIAAAITAEYGQTAAAYGCTIESVVYGFMSSRTPTVKGYVLSTEGAIDGSFRSALRFDQNGAGSVYGATKSRAGESGDYLIEGLVDGSIIEASMISSAEGNDLALFGDISTRGSRALMKGVVVSCN